MSKVKVACQYPGCTNIRWVAAGSAWKVKYCVPHLKEMGYDAHINREHAFKVHGLFKQGYTPPEIAKELHMLPSNIKRILARPSPMDEPSYKVVKSGWFPNINMDWRGLEDWLAAGAFDPEAELTMAGRRFRVVADGGRQKLEAVGG